MEILFFLGFLPLLLYFLNGINTLSLAEKPMSFEAIYQFGDSTADTGNAALISNDQCGQPPYGQTFFHHPGRCSDGLLIIDFFAQALQLPLLEPYLNRNGNFTHGVNFAVSGATALNVSTLADKNIYAPNLPSLLVQLDWFKSHLSSLPFTPSECKEKLGKALFLVGEIGGNDYNYGAYQGKTMEDLRALVPAVIQTIIKVVKELIDLGAQRIVVPGNFPVGCMTVYLARFKTDDSTMYDELNCLRNWNEFATFQNDQLQNAIKDLRKQYPDIDIIYADYYRALTSILERAPLLGFDEDELLKACCGRGDNEYNYDSNNYCGSHGVPVCPDPNKRISWDGIHPTQHTYQLMANWLLKYILPTNVQVA